MPLIASVVGARTRAQPWAGQGAAFGPQPHKPAALVPCQQAEPLPGPAQGSCDLAESQPKPALWRLVDPDLERKVECFVVEALNLKHLLSE